MLSELTREPTTSSPALSPFPGKRGMSPLFKWRDLGRLIMLDQPQHRLQELIQERMAMPRPHDRRLGLAAESRLGLQRRRPERHAPRAELDRLGERRLQQ